MKIWYFITFFFLTAFVQAQDYPINQYINYLAINDENQSLRLNELIDEIKTKNDNSSLMKLIPLMEENVKKKNNKFLKIRFNYLKLVVLRALLNDNNHGEFIEEFRKNVAAATELNNEMLLADGCYWFAFVLNENQFLAEALFYNMKSIDIVEKSGSEEYFCINQRYHLLGELLYHTREYERSIEYSKKALRYWDSKPQQIQRAFTLNDIGLAYQKLGKSDSAIAYFDRASKSAATTDLQVWVTIPNANKAQIFFSQQKYNEALPLFEADYRESTKVSDFPNMANNLQWMAKVYLKQNKQNLALKTAKMALVIIEKYPTEPVKANVCQTLYFIYQSLNKPDSAHFYRDLYSHIHDRLEAKAATSRSEIVQLRLNDENNQRKIDLLQNDLKKEKFKISAIIVLTILLIFGIYFFYYRHRLELLKQKELKESELLAAKEQLHLISKNVFEKSELIHGLQEQLEKNGTQYSVQQRLQDLKGKTILTEQDWIDFKDTFDRVDTGFFERVKKMSPGITAAELRFAAIMRLQLDNKEAGAMLGISADSARKTRVRLRQRLNISEKSDLEQVILSI
jgi:tetratricopeptide (TPR) repeat protein